MNLILCGLSGCGKTTVGKILSAKLGKSFIDTDKNVEILYEKRKGTFLSCRQITIKEGSLFFQDLENQVVQDLIKQQNAVISTGGATVLTPKNQILKSIGKMIYLQAESSVLLPRILRDGIPTYLNGDPSLQSFEKLANSRQPIYQSLADHIIQIGILNPEEIAAKICEIDHFDV